MNPLNVNQSSIRRHSHSLSSPICGPHDYKSMSSPPQDVGGMGIINEEDDIAEPYDLRSSGSDIIESSNNYGVSFCFGIYV